MSVLAGTRLLMTTDAVGGVWTFSTALARALAARGVQVLLVSMGPRPSDAQRAMVAGQAGVRLHETDLELEWQDPAAADFARARSVLRDIVRQYEPDLLHFNGFREAALGWDKPSLVVAHSCVNSWMEGCGQADAFSNQAWTIYTRNVVEGLREADAWVAPTASFRAWVGRRYGVAATGYAIWNGLDVVERPTAPKRPVILAVGRVWDAAKNLTVLGPVAAELDWPVRIAGAADVNSPAARATIVHCDVLGALSPADVQSEMQQAAIFVSPALYEPFGLSVLEAARAGCALILSDLPSFRELWNGVAMFVDPRDPAALQRALLKLSADSLLRRRMQQAAVERSRRYALEDTADGYCALYAEMLARPASRSAAEQTARMSA